MADSKENINRHLNSAQQWLSQAEQAFEKDKDVRGELNLFLAQAELTHAREANRTGHARYKYPMLRHSIAFCLAAAVAVGGMGISYWWGVSHNSVKPSPAKMQASQAVPITPVNSTISREVPISPAETAQVQPASERMNSEPSRLPEKPKSSPKAAESKEIPLTTDEINKLIRTAGKSLRGQ